MDYFAETSEDSRDSPYFSPNAIGVHWQIFLLLDHQKLYETLGSGNVMDANINDSHNERHASSGNIAAFIAVFIHIVTISLKMRALCLLFPFTGFHRMNNFGDHKSTIDEKVRKFNILLKQRD